MKKNFLAVCLLVLAVVGRSQVMLAKAQWATFTVPQMKCWECKHRLEQYMLQETGAGDQTAVYKVVVNMFAGTVRIQYAPDRITIDYLRIAIANAGYDVDTVKANADAYKLLPPVCKRKDEGGGPQKGAPCNVPPEGEEKK